MHKSVKQATAKSLKEAAWHICTYFLCQVTEYYPDSWLYNGTRLLLNMLIAARLEFEE